MLNHQFLDESKTMSIWDGYESLLESQMCKDMSLGQHKNNGLIS